MNIETVMNRLQAMSSENYKKNVVRLGIPEANSIGVPTPKIRALAKEIGTNHDLAIKLWQTQFHECMLLATLLFDNKLLTYDELNAYVHEIRSWDLCDQFCKEVVYQSPHNQQCIDTWIQSHHTFVQRAGFVAMCTNVIHDKKISSSTIDTYTQTCIHYATSDNDYVKKAISWVFREIGKLDLNNQETIINECHKLLEMNDKHASWIAKDVLKEVEILVAIPGRRKLISKHSKMAKEARQ